MKLRDLVKHLVSNGCYRLWEGGNHSIYVNPDGGKSSSVPRHKEINDFLAKKICRDLDVPLP